MNRNFISVLPILSILLASGCDGILPDKDREPLPGEQGVYQQYREALSPIFESNAPTETEVLQAAENFRGAVNTDLSQRYKYPRSEVKRYKNAQKYATRRIEEDILSQLRTSRDLEEWPIVLGAIEAYWVLEPSKLLYSELYQYAQKMIAIPTLKNVGHTEEIEFDREIILFEVNDPKTKTKITTRVVEGQVFYNNRFKLEEIVGDFTAYKIRYLDVEDYTFLIKGTKLNGPDLSDLDVDM